MIRNIVGLRALRAYGFVGLAVIASLTVGTLALGGPTQAALSPSEIQTLASDIVAEGRPIGPHSVLRNSVPTVAVDTSPLVAASPASATAADVVLSLADLGPDFVLVSSGEASRFGAGWRVQTFRRAGRLTQYIEPDGVFYVRSLAVLAPDVGSADQVFDKAANDLLAGTEEVPLPAVAERARGAVEWGQGPFDPAAKIMVFRTRSVVGFVVVAGFEAPANMDDILPLARIMVAKAGR